MFSFPPKVRHASYNIAISALWISLLGNIFAVLYQSDVILGITAKKYCKYKSPTSIITSD